MKKNLNITNSRYREEIFAIYAISRFHCMRATILIFVVEQEKLRTTCIHSDFWARTVASFKTRCTSVRGKKYWKSILWNLHRYKAIIMSYFWLLEVGHNITIKHECLINWYSTTSTIEGLCEDGTVNSTTPPLRTLCTFWALWDSSRPEKTAMENSINVSLLSMVLQKLKSSLSRRPSWYAQW